MPAGCTNASYTYGIGLNLSGVAAIRAGDDFAGWYKDMAFTDPYTETPAEDDVKYAKLVAPETFDLKVQIVPVETGDENAVLRVISSVDSEFYQSATLTLTHIDGVKTYNLTTFYRSLTEYSGLEAMTDPTVFSDDSKYFVSKKALLPAVAFNHPVTATLTLTTCDGTEIEGGSYTFTVDAEYVFAGWYHDAEFTTPFTEAPAAGEEAYAKYVHKDTFGTVVQVVEPNEGDTSVRMRVVSSIDNADYQTVKYIVRYGDVEKTYDLTTFYRKLSEYSGFEAITDPTEYFSEDSKYFVSKKVLLGDYVSGTEVTITTVFTAPDGTVFYGEEAVLSVDIP